MRQGWWWGKGVGRSGVTRSMELKERCEVENESDDGYEDDVQDKKQTQQTERKMEITTRDQNFVPGSKGPKGPYSRVPDRPPLDRPPLRFFA